MRLNSNIVAIALAGAVAACSPSAPAVNDGAAVNAPPPVANQAIAEAELPNLMGNQTETVERAPCPSTPGTMCIGPLIVRAEGLTLQADGRPSSDGDRQLTSTGNLVFENRTGAPVRLAILGGPTDVLFENGVRLGVRYNGITGVHVCRDDGAECFQGAPERFQALAPGDSPARANIGFEGRMDGSLAASLPSVQSGTVTLQAYVVDARNVGSVLNIALPNVPVRNQLRQ